MSSDQTWNPQRYAEHAHFVPALGQPLLDLLNVKAGERILDLACGDGVLSKKITDVGGIVVGVDSSAEMMKVCTARIVVSPTAINCSKPRKRPGTLRAI